MTILKGGLDGFSKDVTCIEWSGFHPPALIKQAIKQYTSTCMEAVWFGMPEDIEMSTVSKRKMCQQWL
jgi:hypothetical protein